jgi:hypothetical protein
VRTDRFHVSFAPVHCLGVGGENSLFLLFEGICFLADMGDGYRVDVEATEKPRGPLMRWHTIGPSALQFGVISKAFENVLEGLHANSGPFRIPIRFDSILAARMEVRP